MTSSPDNPEFKEFKKSWDRFSDKSSFKTLNIANRQLKNQREVVINFLREMLSSSDDTLGLADSLPVMTIESVQS